MRLLLFFIFILDDSPRVWRFFGCAEDARLTRCFKSRTPRPAELVLFAKKKIDQKERSRYKQTQTKRKKQEGEKQQIPRPPPPPNTRTAINSTARFLCSCPHWYHSLFETIGRTPTHAQDHHHFLNSFFSRQRHPGRLDVLPGVVLKIERFWQ